MGFFANHLVEISLLPPNIQDAVAGAERVDVLKLLPEPFVDIVGDRTNRAIEDLLDGYSGGLEATEGRNPQPMVRAKGVFRLCDLRLGSDNI